jgi:hypothetical protein
LYKELLRTFKNIEDEIPINMNYDIAHLKKSVTTFYVKKPYNLFKKAVKVLGSTLSPSGFYLVLFLIA